MNCRGVRKLAVVLALCFAVILPMSGSAAQLVDLQRVCSLTVYPVDPEKVDDAEGGKIAEDLSNDKVVIDLYKVADAVPNGVYDGYDYHMHTAYSTLHVAEEIEAEGWQDLALEALQIALQVSDVTGAQVLKPDRTVKAETAVQELKAGDLECGLYLLVARDATLDQVDDYTIKSTRTEIGADGQQTEESYISATAAYTTEYAYTFAPVLISLPSKEPDENGIINSANQGDWLYETEVVLKPGREFRYGPLRIVKRLLSYESEGTQVPATVVFDVEAVWHDRVVYSDVVALYFTGAGTQEIVIEDKIPVGSQVTVTERYGGSSYSLIEGETAEKVEWILDEEIGATVTFTNDYSEEDRGGHGITNNFVYEDVGGGNLDWKWTQDPVAGDGEGE